MTFETKIHLSNEDIRQAILNYIESDATDRSVVPDRVEIYSEDDGVVITATVFCVDAD